jgi:hypothetical protein
MFKKMLFTAALTGLLAGAAVPVQSSTAEAASGCRKAAHAKFAGDLKARHAYRKECKGHYKVYASKKHHWFNKAS